MAHTCPRCGQYCTCNGDGDDMDFGVDGRCRRDHDGCTSEDDDFEDSIPDLEETDFDDPLDKKPKIR
jgi:hypothetical protein